MEEKSYPKDNKRYLHLVLIPKAMLAVVNPSQVTVILYS